ncbi:SDR family oxidoreductase [bacterium]|nr:SDR family oxidoreductase [bacterium]
MSGRFEGRAVYVTGAASGLGKATAERFGREGARVLAVDVNGDGVVETVNALRAAGSDALGAVVDVSDADSVAASVAHMVEAFGGVDVLVNVAGIGRAARFEEIDESEWNRTLAVNLTGAFHTTQAALPHLLRRSGANIVNVASIAGLRGHAYCSAYSASKAALISLTRSLALEFTSRGLRANCVAPGGIMTPLIAGFIPREDFERELLAYYSPPPPGNLSTVEDVTASIAFLASPEARTINGAVLVCDGGTMA